MPETKSGTFLSHTATYAVGNIARRAVGFAMLPIYTRFLSPADYGVVGLLTFALAFFEPLFGARLVRAIPKFYFDVEDGRSQRAVFWSALILTSVVSLVSMSALIIFRGVGSDILFGDTKYSLALGVFAANLVTQPFENAGMMYLRLKQNSRLFVLASMVKLAMQVVLNVVLVVHFQYGVLGVVLSGVVSSGVLGGALTAYTWKREAPAIDWRIARRMIQFCWPLWLSGLAGLYIGSSGAMYLRVFDTLSDVGRLELALRFATAVGMLVWAPFFQHWEPMSYQYYKEPNGRWKFQVAFIASSALMIGCGLAISVFAQPVIGIMATKSFYRAAEVVPILTLGFILNNLVSFFNFSFLATGNTKIFSLCQYMLAGVITVTYLLLVPLWGLAGAAVAQCLAFIIGFGLIWYLSRRYYDPEFSLKPIGLFLMIGVLAYMSSNVLYHSNSIGVDLAVKGGVFVVALTLMTLVGIRMIRSVNALALNSLPWPLDRLGRMTLGA